MFLVFVKIQMAKHHELYLFLKRIEISEQSIKLKGPKIRDG
jgi:hypothetical protein